MTSSLPRMCSTNWATQASRLIGRAGDGTRTRDQQLGRLWLYQLSYSRKLYLLSFSNLTRIQSHQPGKSPTIVFLLPSFIIVGREGFEPPKAEADRFTVCCVWPLRYLPSFLRGSWLFTSFPPDTQTSVKCKSIHLLHRIKCFLALEPMRGLEPPTSWLQISCSTNWATSAFETSPMALTKI